MIIVQLIISILLEYTAFTGIKYYKRREQIQIGGFCILQFPFFVLKF